jgi:hypothetical protein
MTRTESETYILLPGKALSFWFFRLSGLNRREYECVVASCLTLTCLRCSKVNAGASGEAFFGRPKVGVMCFFPVYSGFN